MPNQEYFKLRKDLIKLHKTICLYKCKGISADKFYGLYSIRKMVRNLCVSASVAPQSFPAFMFTAGPTWCAAAGVTADGTSSRSRSSGRVWSPGGCAGAGPGRRRWRTSLSSGDTCVVWPPCGTWSESASLTWLRRWAGTLCILVTEKRDTKRRNCGVIRLLQSS